MFTRCLFCHADLPANELIAHYPHGRRLAFDPGRGRLWAVCSACHRWNLAPIEERWEALEELDRLVTDRGKLLSKTDNIALLRAGEIEVVRVGQSTKLVEEAWWRYGRELRERRTRHSKLNWIEMGAAVAISVTAGGAWWWFQGDALSKLERWRKFGSVAWQGQLECPKCGHMLEQLRFKDTGNLVVVAQYGAADGDETVALAWRCTRCKHIERAEAPPIRGTAAQRVLRRSLAWHHYAGASEKRIREATQVIESAGTVHHFARGVADQQLTLQTLNQKAHRTKSIALEIALNDDAERRLLELELQELEQRWREEEEIAAIADDELTPVPALEKLRRLINPDARPSRVSTP